jgi:L-ascorbate metabolism protein UlaG (beta-lactamase superfamily)
MKIKYLGHASFLITAASGVSIVTDPYTPGEGFRYGEITETADIVTVSHQHTDHNNAGVIGGNPRIISSYAPAEIKGIKIRGLATHHDEAGGTKRGMNTIFCLGVDGINLCHLGDLGHPLNDQQAAKLGRVDILLLPVGGYFTIDAPTASRVGNQIAPRILIPMHFKTDKLDYPIAGIDEFLRDKPRQWVTQLEVSEAEFKPGVLPMATQIIVLKPAL